MTAYDVIAKFAPADMDRLSSIFLYLAEHSYEARLKDGKQIRDATDFRYFLRELSEAAIVAMGRDCADVVNRAERRPVRRLVESTCFRCGHVHQGSAECGQEMGQGRICRWEVEVTV
jgi:hypothetical protein